MGRVTAMTLLWLALKLQVGAGEDAAPLRTSAPRLEGGVVVDPLGSEFRLSSFSSLLQEVGTGLNISEPEAPHNSRLDVELGSCRSEWLYCVRESCLCITPGSLTGWHEAEGDLGTNEAITILFPYLEGLDALQLRGIFQGVTGVKPIFLAKPKSIDCVENESDGMFHEVCKENDLSCLEARLPNAEDVKLLFFDASTMQAESQPTISATLESHTSKVDPTMMVFIVRNPVDQYLGRFRSAITEAMRISGNQMLENERKIVMEKWVSKSYNYNDYFDSWFQDEYMPYMYFVQKMARTRRCLILRYEDLLIDKVTEFKAFASMTGIAKAYGMGMGTVSTMLTNDRWVVFSRRKLKKLGMEPSDKNFQGFDQLNIADLQSNVLNGAFKLLKDFGYLFTFAGDPNRATIVEKISKANEEEEKDRQVRANARQQQLGKWFDTTALTLPKNAQQDYSAHMEKRKLEGVSANDSQLEFLEDIWYDFLWLLLLLVMVPPVFGVFISTVWGHRMMSQISRKVCKLMQVPESKELPFVAVYPKAKFTSSVTVKTGVGRASLRPKRPAGWFTGVVDLGLSADVTSSSNASGNTSYALVPTTKSLVPTSNAPIVPTSNAPIVPTSNALVATFNSLVATVNSLVPYALVPTSNALVPTSNALVPTSNALARTSNALVPTNAESASERPLEILTQRDFQDRSKVEARLDILLRSSS